MCGIFGAIGPNLKPDLLTEIAQQAGRRGPHANGIAWLEAQAISFRKRLGQIDPKSLYKDVRTLALIGNCRLSTSGSHLTPGNNQPMVCGGVAVSHNGNVSNARDVAAELGAELQTECDSEIICHCILKEGIERTLKRLQDARPLALLILNAGGIIAYRAGQPLFAFSAGGCHYLCSRPFSGAELIPEGEPIKYRWEGL